MSEGQALLPGIGAGSIRRHRLPTGSSAALDQLSALASAFHELA
jgi:hypothetical protein